MAQNGYEIYETIRLDSYLERLLPGQSRFISPDSYSELKKEICDKYGEDRNCFKTNGSLEDIAMSDLKFYQAEVGIYGPRHTDPDEPVSVLRYENMLLLYNGYHRTFIKMLNNETSLKGYILTL
jgi:hypothetical protein